MAYSAVGYTGDGATRQYSIPFDYISDTEVFVFVGTIQKRKTIDYTITLGVLVFNASPTAGSAIEIYRRTDLAKRKVEWQPGGSFTAADQNLNSKQLFFICQELYDLIQGVITGSGETPVPATGDYDVQSLILALNTFLSNHTTITYP